MTIYLLSLSYMYIDHKIVPMYDCYLCIAICMEIWRYVVSIAYIAWPFTILQNNNITILWDFLRLKGPAAMPGHLGAVNLKKSHDIVILSFCNIVKGQANCHTI